MGDFNEIGGANDKLGGVAYLSSRSTMLSFLFLHVSYVDLPFSGSRFTSRKKKGGPNNILERLDRAVASIRWLAKFPKAKVQHHNFISSDHCCISLSFDNLSTTKAPPFRFEKMWCSRKDYNTLVKKTWCTQFASSHMFRLVSKCKLLKTKSKIWNQQQFGHIFRQLRSLDSKLTCIQVDLLLDQVNVTLLQKQDLLLQKRCKLISFGHEYWKQKSKTTYLKLGDANTSYFHAHASIRRNGNQISEFTSHDGIVLTAPSDISNAITH